MSPCTSEVLYKKAKTGKLLMWKVEVLEDNGVPCIVTTSGYVDGKQNSNKRFVKRGTNKGKANEKTPLEHALFLADNAHKARVEAGFINNAEEALNAGKLPLQPMLAAGFNRKMLNIDFFPKYAQPKFNGVRCTMYRHVEDETFWSRARKPFTTLDFMLDEIREFFGDYSPDGEIYIHGMPLQNIISLLKRKQPGTENLKYVVYDLAIPGVVYEERKSILDWLLNQYIMKHGSPKYIEVAPSKIVYSMEQLNDAHEAHIRENYEGTIIRDLKAEYAFNDRSKALLKYKNFQDSEFEIVDGIEEVYYDKLNDVHKSIIIWVCRNESGDRTFHVRPLGTVEEKEKLYKERDKHIGKKLTVRYLELSTDGVPIGNPVGIAIRDYE